MYCKWIAALLLTAGMTASAQTTDKKQREEEVKEKRQKTTIVVDGDRVIINGKDVKDMSPEEREQLGKIKINPSIRVRPEGVYRRPLQVFDDAFVRKSDGTPRAFLGVMSEKNEKGAKSLLLPKKVRLPRPDFRKTISLPK